MIDGPFAPRDLVQAAGILAEAAAIHPLIFHQAAHIGARLRDGDAFHEEKRIVLAGLGLEPTRRGARACIIGAAKLEQISIQPVEQLGNVSLAQRQGIGGIIELGERFTVYHIETEKHAIVLAEGTLAETFIDNVSRRLFDNYAEFESLYGDEIPIVELDQPRAMSARQVPRAIRERLAMTAGQLAPAVETAA